jgi:hypothetical protein
MKYGIDVNRWGKIVPSFSPRVASSDKIYGPIMVD